MSMQSFGLIDMQLRLDPDARILYVVVGHSGNMALETRDLDERRAVDYDLAGDIVGIEFRDIDEGVDLDGVPHASRLARALQIMGAVQYEWSEGGK